MSKPMSPTEWRAALAKWSVPVKYYPGWESRGRPGTFTNVIGLVIHHTGSDAGQDDGYDTFLFSGGRPAEGIPAPLCQASIDMDGDFHMGAAGRANHAGVGSTSTSVHVAKEDYPGYERELVPGADAIDGNAIYYGFEVKYDGGQPMTAKQYRTAVLAACAVDDFHGWSALSNIAHREHSRRKPDPGHCPMDQFRRDVRAQLKAGPPGAKRTRGRVVDAILSMLPTVKGKQRRAAAKVAKDALEALPSKPVKG